MKKPPQKPSIWGGLLPVPSGRSQTHLWPTPNAKCNDIKEYLRTHAIEGLVFWKDGEPQCKIKRSDFGFKWPVTEATLNEIIG